MLRRPLEKSGSMGEGRTRAQFANPIVLGADAGWGTKIGFRLFVEFDLLPVSVRPVFEHALEPVRRALFEMDWRPGCESEALLGRGEEA